MSFKAHSRSRLRLLPILAVCMLCLGATSKSCKLGKQARENDNDRDDLSFVTTLDILNDARQSDVSFGPGEIIRFELHVRNRLDRRITLDLGSPPTHDFVLIDPDTEQVVWRASEIRTDLTATRVRIAANDTLTFEYEWDQSTATGLPLPRKDYEVRGFVPFDFEEFETDPYAVSQLASMPLSITLE